MDKTHNIGLGGFSFSIEDSAYNKLKNYLIAVRTQLKNNEDRDEIIADVEYRMAELLKERLKIREVVNTEDINYIISTMGTPEAYNELDDSTTANQEHYSTSDFPKSSFAKKKLFRDPDYRILGGVCSGLGYYFGIERVWIRLALCILPFLDILFLNFSTGTVFLLYIILWIIVPEARTTSEKLQMRGEPVNVDSIKEFSGHQKKNTRRNNNFFLTVFKVFFKVIVAIFLVMLFMVCLALIIAIVALIFGIGVGVSGLGMTTIALSDYLPLFFDNQLEIWLMYISTFLVFVLPLIGFILFAITLISKRFKVDKKVTTRMIFSFIISFIIFIIIGGLTLRNFATKESIITKKEIRVPSDTLIINNVTDFEGKKMNDVVEFKNNKYAYKREDSRDLSVAPTNDSIPYFEIEYSAKGKNSEDAEKNLSKIHYTPRVSGNNIYLDNFLSFEKGTKWREQRVNITLFLPEGKFISGKNFRDFVVKGQRDWNDHQDIESDKIYGFVNGKFTCINCPKKEDDDTEDDLDDSLEEKRNNINEIEIKVDSTSNKKKVDVRVGDFKMKIEK
ncbi:PspC domain-containing protein [Weeksellaceae bacterium TAE3-ERU29]|nr:PspC domain-containing protein [Weeksellaceae bacterium TAE3-ERU29]